MFSNVIEIVLAAAVCGGQFGRPDDPLQVDALSGGSAGVSTDWPLPPARERVLWSPNQSARAALISSAVSAGSGADGQDADDVHVDLFVRRRVIQAGRFR